jgi:hypothetical protein
MILFATEFLHCWAIIWPLCSMPHLPHPGGSSYLPGQCHTRFCDNQLNLSETCIKTISTTPLRSSTYSPWLPSIIISLTWHASKGSYHLLLKRAWHPCYIGILSWFWMLHVCLGRLSKSWAKSAVLYSPQESNGVYQLSLFFLATWTHHNQTVHRASTKDHCWVLKNENASLLPCHRSSPPSHCNTTFSTLTIT